jgi:hypothetical protein
MIAKYSALCICIIKAIADFYSASEVNGKTSLKRSNFSSFQKLCSVTIIIIKQYFVKDLLEFFTRPKVHFFIDPIPFQNIQLWNRNRLKNNKINITLHKPNKAPVDTISAPPILRIYQNCQTPPFTEYARHQGPQNSRLIGIFMIFSSIFLAQKTERN